MHRKKNPNHCEVFQEGSEITVHFYTNKMHMDSDSYDSFLDAFGSIQDWMKAGNE